MNSVRSSKCLSTSMAGTCLQNTGDKNRRDFVLPVITLISQHPQLSTISSTRFAPEGLKAVLILVPFRHLRAQERVALDLA